MLFRSYRPVPPLSDFIEHFWLYDGYSSAHVHERIFPTGAFELVFNLRDDELRIYEGNESRLRSRYSGALVSGPYDGFFVTDRAEEASVMGVHFRPGGAFPFLGLSAYELANAHIDLATIWGRQAEEIRERLAVAPSSGQRFRFLENTLLSRLRRPLEHHPAVSLALSGLRSENSHAVVRKLAREAGVSDHRFIDVFRSEVGLNPKLFHRVQRFQRVLIKVHRLPEPEWEQLALENGYFDQSHLIRDFLAFSGFSPADYLRRLKELRKKGLHVKFNHLPVSK
jgi:AraC-like DNA-binding protein